MKALLSCVALSLTLACVPLTQEEAVPGPSKPSSSPAPSWELEPQPSDATGSTDRFASPPAAAQESPAASDSAPQERAPEPSTSAPSYPPPPPSEHAPRAMPSGTDRKSAAAPRADRGRGAPSARGGGAESEGRGVLAERRAPRPDVDERPGLGTSWGETRYSAVNDVPFERDRGGPCYTGALNYNDARGAYALAGSGMARSSAASITLGGALSVSLRDAYGNALSAYRGEGRTVAIGRDGERYSIVVQNHTNERFEVVLSVDGLDVIDGRPASYGKRGYLIDPYATITIDGFRQSESAVAAFRFGSVARSYAALTGSARNVGVIGAAAFGEWGYAARLQAYRERVAAWRASGIEVERRRDADPFPERYATPPLQIVR